MLTTNKIKKSLLILITSTIISSGANALDVTFTPTLDAANTLSSANKIQPDFGVFSATWTSGQTIILNTDDTVSGTGTANHHGSHASGSIDILGSAGADVTVGLDVTTTQPTNTSFVFSAPKCKWGGDTEATCTTLNKTIDTSGTTIVKVGATLTATTTSITDSALNGSTWTLTVTYA